MNFTEYIRHIVQLRGYSFAYGDASEINRVLTTMDFSQSKNDIVAFAHLITEEENDDHARATLAVFFCHLCPLDFDANDTGEWQGYLRNAANTMFSDISAGNIARTSNMRYMYGYNDYAENVLWVCARFTIEALQCGCNEYVFRDEIVKNIEYVRTLENGDYEYKITFTDGSTQMFASPRGPQGDDGPPGTTDYNELQNKPTKLSDFANDEGFITSNDAAETYVAKESGKGLSSNDYTTAEKNKLAGIEAGAQKNPTAVSQLENDAKYLKLQEVKPNGNIVLTDGTNSKEYMAATPSGDPMHYAYVAAGATWNASTGYWELNGLYDITNEQMSYIAFADNPSPGYATMWSMDSYGASDLGKCRTTPKRITSNQSKNIVFPTFNWNKTIESIGFCISNSNVIRLSFGNSTFYSCIKLSHIYDILYCDNSIYFSNFAFRCYELIEIRIRNLSNSISFSDSAKLSKDSILDMITNAGTAAFTITLHADAYARAMADTDIQAALATKTNVSLASA